MPDAVQKHAAHHQSSVWPLAALGTAGALIVSPYVLPAIGIGNIGAAQDVSTLLHAHEAGSTGSGIAGLITEGMSHVPGLGETLVANGWGTVATAGFIGIGGVLLANWMEKREGPNQFPWSKVIRYGSLATSMLISLPAILTGVSIGIAFLGSLFISEAATFNMLLAGLSSTLGSVPMATATGAGGSLLATMLPHLISCGAALVPASLAYFMSKEQPSPRVETTTAKVYPPLKPLQTAAQAL